MSLLSSIIVPKLKQELLALEPEVAAFILNQLKILAADIVEWAEIKAHIEAHREGILGEDKSEEN